VVVVTLRGVKYHGGVAAAQLHLPDMAALQAGLANPLNQIRRLQRFGIPTVVALNTRAGERPEEHQQVMDFFAQEKCPAFAVDVYQHGGAGALALADYVAQFRQPAPLEVTYSLADSIDDKIRQIATRVYGAQQVEFSALASQQIASIRKMGMDHAYAEFGPCLRVYRQDSVFDQ
jgi:formate--tetrahydrofolate ligase